MLRIEKEKGQNEQAVRKMAVMLETVSILAYLDV
jgi:hypothetical protein